MKLVKIILILFLALLLLASENEAEAQARASLYFELGSNQVSQGMLFKTGLQADYSFGKNNVGGGLQIDAISNNFNFLSGYYLNATRTFAIREFPFDVQAFYLGTNFSNVVRESDWGLLLAFQRDHFGMHLGTNLRTYGFTREAVDLFRIDKTSRIHENWNLMYSFSYCFRESDNLWNLALAMTNIDYFSIQQETNPIFNLTGHYRVSPTLDLFAETWYKSSGALNLSVNYFGYFFRVGMIWEIW